MSSAQAEPVEARSAPPTGILLATAYPANLARRRNASGEEWLSAGGRGFRLDPASPLARAEWLAIGEAQGEARGARIISAIALDPADIERWLPERIERRSRLDWNAAEARVEGRLERRLGAIVLASAPDPAVDQAAVEALLLDRAKLKIAGLLPGALTARARHAGVAVLEPGALAETAGTWLAPLLVGRRDLALEPGAVARAALDALPWDERQRLDRLAPREFASPAGTTTPIDYADDGGPSVEVRVQALFGLDRHPMIGEGRAATAEADFARRATDPDDADLPGVLARIWRDVVKEMKGRYPRHRWPDEPWTEKPSLKTKNAFQRTQSLI